MRSAVSGRFVNGYSRNDWVLNYLFRATSGGLSTVAGLRAIEDVPGLENVDVTDKIAGHMSYRTFMPLILDQLGFPVSADYFDEPVVSDISLLGAYFLIPFQEPDFEGDRIVVREEAEPKKRSWFSRKNKDSSKVTRPPTASSHASSHKKTDSVSSADDDLPPRESTPTMSSPIQQSNAPIANIPASDRPLSEPATPDAAIPKYAGFDLSAMTAVINESESKPEELRVPAPNPFHTPLISAPHRSESAPPPASLPSSVPLRAQSPTYGQAVAGPSSSRHDLSSTLARSMSLNNIRATTESDEDEDDTLPDRRTPTGYEASSSLPPPFTSAQRSKWYTGPGHSAASNHHLEQTRFSGYPLNGGMPYNSPAPPARNTFLPPDSGSLSFGGTDGSITFSPQTRPDPWDIAPPVFGNYNSKKSSSALNLDLNPWQT